MLRNVLVMMIFVATSLTAEAQLIKRLTTNDGLSNRRVYAIVRDSVGYTWFLTYTGIDRYNGSTFTHFPLLENGLPINVQRWSNKLQVDSRGRIWEFGYDGNVFYYNDEENRFKRLSIPSAKGQFTLGALDAQDRLWLGRKGELLVFDTRTGKVLRLKNTLTAAPTSLIPIDQNTVAIAGEQGLYWLRMSRTKPHYTLQKFLNRPLAVSQLYYHAPTRQLIIATRKNGIFCYNLDTRKLTDICTPFFENVCVENIIACPDHENELMLGTVDAGVLKLQLPNGELRPFLHFDSEDETALPSSSISALCMDTDRRLWMAIYPLGVAVYTCNFPACKWYRHGMGNVQTIGNEHVNGILQDSDGDLWFATSNGISVFNRGKNRWHHVLQGDVKGCNRVFITLCEVGKGLVLAAGYGNGAYRIHKSNFSCEYLTPAIFSTASIEPNRYIRSIYKDRDGIVWTGGYFNLGRNDPKQKVCESFVLDKPINCIVERDSTTLWVGTARGLFIFDKTRKRFVPFDLPTSCKYVSALWQSAEGTLFIGTDGAGMFVYNPRKSIFQHYTESNSSLLSDRIFTLLADTQGRIILSAEGCLSRFSPRYHTFRNFTREQGLSSTEFNYGSGVHTRDGTFLFGTAEGAVEISDQAHVPRQHYTKLEIEDFRVVGTHYYIGRNTKEICLPYDKNTIALTVGTINYDDPSSQKYAWRLLGQHTDWIMSGGERRFMYTSLRPGNYRLQIRAYAKENAAVVDERDIALRIMPPWWGSSVAVSAYLLLAVGLLFAAVRYVWMLREHKQADDKVRFYMQMAHEVHTPLSLIQAPLELLEARETLSEKGREYLHTIKSSLELLKRFSDSVTDFKLGQAKSLELVPTELNAFVADCVEPFLPLAQKRNIGLACESNFDTFRVWIDVRKMENVMQNLLSNAFKYTPEAGDVRVSTEVNASEWRIVVSDTGIGIPRKEQSKLFNLFFRASNVAPRKKKKWTHNNAPQDFPGTGIGLALVHDLVTLHKGTVEVESRENFGSTFILHFPLYTEMPDAHRPQDKPCATDTQEKPALLLVEDNVELLRFLSHELAADYDVSTAVNAEMALEQMAQTPPQIVVSDVMMPGMDGHEFCRRIKNDVATCHIPVVMLSALSDSGSVVNGLQAQADSYLTKPFHINVLKATLATLLKNRAMLRERYLRLTKADDTDAADIKRDRDAQFIVQVKHLVLQNLVNPAFSVDSLCDELHLSRTTFYTKLKALTGCAPSDFVRRIRLDHAAELLQTHCYTVNEVADRCGFCDAKYFRIVFKKHFNQSPTEYAGKK